MKNLFILCLALLWISCSKHNTDNKTCAQYVPGQVVAGVSGSSSIEDVFSLVNSLNLQIDHMSGFYYTSPYPKDSILSLKSILSNKPYINARGFTASVWPHYQTQILHVTNTLWDMSPINQQDWIVTKSFLQLNDTQGDTKNMLLLVPAGEEKRWLQKLKQYKMITWTELNCFGEIEPL